MSVFMGASPSIARQRRRSADTGNPYVALRRLDRGTAMFIPGSFASDGEMSGGQNRLRDVASASAATDPQRSYAGSRSRSAAVSWRTVVCYCRGGSAEGSPAPPRFRTIQIWPPLGEAKCRMQIVCFFRHIYAGCSLALGLDLGTGTFALSHDDHWSVCDAGRVFAHRRKKSLRAHEPHLVHR